MERLSNTSTSEDTFKLLGGLEHLTDEEIKSIKLISNDPLEGLIWSEMKVPPPPQIESLSHMDKNVCKWYLGKGCKFGPKCKNLHPIYQPMKHAKNAVKKTTPCWDYLLETCENPLHCKFRHTLEIPYDHEFEPLENKEKEQLHPLLEDLDKMFS